MKLKGIKVVLGICTIAILIYAYQRMPEDFNVAYHGVKVKLDDDSILEHSIIEFDGVFKRDFFLHEFFIGSFTIDGQPLVVESPVYQRDKVHIDISRAKKEIFGGDVNYQYRGELYVPEDQSFLGRVYFSDDYKIFMYKVPDKDRGQWHGNTGEVIIAPATNRKEAFIVGQEFLLGDYGHELED